jgi:hypothetical protein
VLSNGIERYGVSGNTLIFFLFAFYDKKKKGKKLNKRPIWEKGNLSNCQSLVRGGRRSLRRTGSPKGSPLFFTTVNFPCAPPCYIIPKKRLNAVHCGRGCGGDSGIFLHL